MSLASRHLSIRIAIDVVDRIDIQSRRAGLSRLELAKTLIDEGLRIEAHPEIVFRSGPAGRRPGLVGGPDIWELARVLREVGQGGGDALNQTSELMGISREAVARVVRYYAEYRSEVDSWIDASTGRPSNPKPHGVENRSC
jgi:hypothetical protein